MGWLERVTVWLAAAVCLLFAATLRDVAPSSRTLAPPPPVSLGERDARLTVTVKDQRDRPAAEVSVYAYAIVEGRAHRAGLGVTGADGKVVLERLPRGETWIVARRSGLARGSTRLLLQGGERSVELKLGAAQSFEVVAVDQQEKPIAGVHVTIRDRDPLPHVALTDARGLAALDGLGAAPYEVEVSAPGYDGKVLDKLAPADSPLFVKLDRLGRLEVSVVDGQGKPAAGAKVLVAGATLWPARSAVTDATGKVAIARLPRGFYDVRAERGKLVSDTVEGVLLERGDTKEVRLALVDGVQVTVTVTDGEGSGGKPIAGADVAVVEGGISSFPRYGRTNAEGVAVLGPIAGGDATVSAQAQGFVPRSAVPLPEGKTEILLSLMRGATIRGRVIDDRDFPVDGARLEVVGVDIYGMPIVESSDLGGFREDHFAFALPGATPLIPMGELGVMPVVPDVPRDGAGLVVARSRQGGSSWTSRRDGRFSLAPVTPGRVRVIARHPSYVEAIGDALDLGPGGSGEVTLVMRRGGMLEGRVIEESRVPVAGARIEVAAVEGTLERVTYSADDGTFAFAALPGQILLTVARAEWPEHVVEQLTLDIDEGKRREIEILLRAPREEVVFRVTDDHGFAVDRAEVNASSLDPDAPLVRTLFTGDGGEATLADARGLPLRVVARRSGKAPLVLQLERAPKEVELSLSTGAKLEGSVASRDGPLAGAQVVLLTPTGARKTRTAPDGGFALGDLALGSARLLVNARGFVPHERIVTVVEATDLGRIDLAAGASLRGTVVDGKGDPVIGARVAVGRVPTYLPIGELPAGVAATDEKGRFHLRDIAPGRALIEVFKVGFGRAQSEEITVRAGDTGVGVRLVLEPDPEAEDRTFKAAASLAVTLGESAGGIVFEHVPLDGEAQRAGILPGDRLFAVNGVSVKTLEQARHGLNGPISRDMVLSLGREPNLRWLVRVRRERLRR